MEREKQIKLTIAGVIGVAAVVILAMQFVGNKKPKETDNVSPAVEQHLSTRGQAPRSER